LTFYRRSTYDFQRWLNARIWMSGGEKEIRKNYMPSFANSVKQWMEMKGYKMDSRWGPMAVAKWLYAIQIAVVARKESVFSQLGYPELLHRNWPEDQDNFDMEVSFEDREEYLERWDACEDFDKTTQSGQKIRLEFEELLWTYVDLENSRQGRKIAYIMEGSDEEDEEDSGRVGVDSYIQDNYDGYH